MGAATWQQAARSGQHSAIGPRQRSTLDPGLAWEPAAAGSSCNSSCADQTTQQLRQQPGSRSSRAPLAQASPESQQPSRPPPAAPAPAPASRARRRTRLCRAAEASRQPMCTRCGQCIRVPSARLFSARPARTPAEDHKLNNQAPSHPLRGPLRPAVALATFPLPASQAPWRTHPGNTRPAAPRTPGCGVRAAPPRAPASPPWRRAPAGETWRLRGAVC